MLLAVPGLVLGTILVRRWRAQPISRMAAQGAIVAAVGELPVGDDTGVRLSRKRFVPLLLFLIPLISFMAFALGYIALNPVDATTEA